MEGKIGLWRGHGTGEGCIRRIRGFVNEAHTEHILFHHYLHLFWASCVITEKLAEAGDESGRVVRNSLSFSMFRKWVRGSSSFRVEKLLLCSFQWGHSKNKKVGKGKVQWRKRKAIHGSDFRSDMGERVPLGEFMMVLDKCFQKQALIGSYCTAILDCWIWFLSLCVLKWLV